MHTGSVSNPAPSIIFDAINFSIYNLLPGTTTVRWFEKQSGSLSSYLGTGFIYAGVLNLEFVHGRRLRYRESTDQ